MKTLFTNYGTGAPNEQKSARFVYQQTNSTPTEMPAEAITHTAVAETMKTVLDMKMAPDLSGESAEDLVALQKGLTTIQTTKALMANVPDMQMPESLQQQISALKETYGQQVQAALTVGSTAEEAKDGSRVAGGEIRIASTKTDNTTGKVVVREIGISGGRIQKNMDQEGIAGEGDTGHIVSLNASRVSNGPDGTGSITIANAGYDIEGKTVKASINRTGNSGIGFEVGGEKNFSTGATTANATVTIPLGRKKKKK